MKQLLNFYTSILKAQNFSEEEIKKATDFLVSESYLEVPDLKPISFSVSDLIYLGERLPSLNKYCMHNFLVYLIQNKRFEDIITFLSKIFVSHIDKYNYTSKGITRLTNLEKTFDRFIECAMWAEIPFDVWQDSFFNALIDNSSVLSNWKRPARSYLIDWSRRDEKDFYSFAFSNFSTYGMTMLNVLIEENISSAVLKLLEYWLKNEFEEKRQVKNILKQHYEEIHGYITELKKESKISNIDLVKVMLIFSYRDDVLKSLSEVYAKAKDVEIKKLIIESAPIVVEEKSVSLTQAKRNSSKYDDNFSVFGLSKTNMPNLILSDGEKITPNMLNYMIDSYKSLCSTKAVRENSFFKALFEQKSLDEFCVFIAKNLDPQNIEKDEWAYCLIAQNSSILCAKDIIFEFASKKETKCYKLFIKIFIDEQKENALTLFNSLNKNIKDEKIVLDALLQGIIESGAYELDVVENLRDKMVPDFNIVNGELKVGDCTLKIMPDWTVCIVDEEKANKEVLIEQKRLQREIERQTKRLKNAFNSARMWNKENWINYIFNNKLMRYFAKKLLWGRYCDKTLISVFKIEGEELKNIASINKINGEYEIGIFHPVEYSELDWRYMFDAKNAPFDQLEMGVYKISDYNVHSSVVSRFNGFMVNSQTFFDRIKQNGWSFGLPSVDKKISNIVKTNKDLGFLAEMSFSPADVSKNETIILGELRFYKLCDVLQTGNNFVINKAKSQELMALKPRYFADIINEITLAGKK